MQAFLFVADAGNGLQTQFVVVGQTGNLH